MSKTFAKWQIIVGITIILIGGIFIFPKRRESYVIQAENIKIDTLSIYDAVDQDFFSHHGSAVITSRRLYQRSNSDDSLQYVVEYTYKTHSGNDFQYSRYLVTQHPNGNYSVKWFPQE